MSIPIRAGVLLGVLCTIWTFVMGFTGWYKDPVMLNLFFLVILLEIGIVIWALRQTAPEATWGGQIVNGLVLSLVASVIIFAGSCCSRRWRSRTTSTTFRRSRPGC